MAFGLSVIVPLTVALLLGSSGFIEGQQECKKVHGPENDWPRSISNYRVAYNISSSKAMQSCYEILENNNGPAKDEVTFKYKIGDVTVSQQANYVLNADGTASIIYKDNANDAFTTYAEVLPSGVIRDYFCQSGSGEQNILLLYVSDKDLSKEADAEAAKLTANPADFKINWDNC